MSTAAREQKRQGSVPVGFGEVGKLPQPGRQIIGAKTEDKPSTAKAEWRAAEAPLHHELAGGTICDERLPPKGGRVAQKHDAGRAARNHIASKMQWNKFEHEKELKITHQKAYWKTLPKKIFFSFPLKMVNHQLV